MTHGSDHIENFKQALENFRLYCQSLYGKDFCSDMDLWPDRSSQESMVGVEVPADWFLEEQRKKKEMENRAKLSVGELLEKVKELSNFDRFMDLEFSSFSFDDRGVDSDVVVIDPDIQTNDNNSENLNYKIIDNARLSAPTSKSKKSFNAKTPKIKKESQKKPDLEKLPHDIKTFAENNFEIPEIQQQNNSKLITCKLCRTKFTSLNESIKFHVEMHIIMTQYYCQLCKLYFKNEKKYLMHKNVLCARKVHNFNMPGPSSSKIPKKQVQAHSGEKRRVLKDQNDEAYPTKRINRNSSSLSSSSSTNFDSSSSDSNIDDFTPEIKLISTVKSANFGDDKICSSPKVEDKVPETDQDQLSSLHQNHANLEENFSNPLEQPSSSYFDYYSANYNFSMSNQNNVDDNEEILLSTQTSEIEKTNKLPSIGVFSSNVTTLQPLENSTFQEYSSPNIHLSSNDTCKILKPVELDNIVIEKPKIKNVFDFDSDFSD